MPHWTALIAASKSDHCAIADHIIVLDAGRISRQGKWTDLKSVIEHLPPTAQERSSIGGDETSGRYTMPPEVGNTGQQRIVKEAKDDLARPTGDLSVYRHYVRAMGQRNLIAMVGMDLHHPSVGAQVWLTVNAPELTRAGIMQEIRARRTSFLFDPAGTRPRAYVDSPASYRALTPLTYLGDYFGMFYDDLKGMYSFQGTFCHPEQMSVHGSVIGWFIFWVFVFMIAFELVRWICVLSWNQGFPNRKRCRRRNSDVL